ncbi:hypothetical protein [Amycolatopsis saalfeldensis]|uniref:Uncharacterized protein n=1 Tax=Amycolatopsis saalfeldensis TaxID=394193 RepID=A0A1H8TE68_9PSEU|nr:hypothetical protein [Amycolatopsis saalfeldensis]SEO89400.1 hypothetical protein SAMN04489732_102580 [Amycolatopsis saalfeldensis]
MTDLDGLRAALAEPPAEAFAAVDVARVMRLGRRRRRYRRLASGAAALAAVAAVAGLLAGVQQWRAPAPPAIGAPPAVLPTPPTTSDSRQIGAVIGTGAVDADGEVVLYLRAFEPDRYLPAPEVRPYELVLGHRTPKGVTAEVVAGSPAGVPGFRALTAGRPGRDVPFYGYYAGPARRVTAEAGGLIYTAETAVVDQAGVTVFWFPRKDTKPLAALPALPMNAYDGQGGRLIP